MWRSRRVARRSWRGRRTRRSLPSDALARAWWWPAGPRPAPASAPHRSSRSDSRAPTLPRSRRRPAARLWPSGRSFGRLRAHPHRLAACVRFDPARADAERAGGALGHATALHLGVSTPQRERMVPRVAVLPSGAALAVWEPRAAPPPPAVSASRRRSGRPAARSARRAADRGDGARLRSPARREGLRLALGRTRMERLRAPALRALGDGRLRGAAVRAGGSRRVHGGGAGARARRRRDACQGRSAGHGRPVRVRRRGVRAREHVAVCRRASGPTIHSRPPPGRGRTRPRRMRAPAWCSAGSSRGEAPSRSASPAAATSSARSRSGQTARRGSTPDRGERVRLAGRRSLAHARGRSRRDGRSRGSGATSGCEWLGRMAAASAATATPTSWRRACAVCASSPGTSGRAAGCG